MTAQERHVQRGGPCCAQGTAANLAWHAALHRLPFNRSLAMLLLHFCMMIGTNGLLVQPMQHGFSDNLAVPSLPARPTTPPPPAPSYSCSSPFLPRLRLF